MLKFIRVDRNAAFFIVLAGIIGLVLANSVSGFSELVEPLHHYSELALALFFFVIGLELKNELTHGVFVNRKALLVPGLAAVFGAFIPAGIYFLVTSSDPIASSGWAIPMATDITFALAVFSIFGSKMPKGSKQFLLAFAIIDDLLAILVIALFLQSDVLTALLVTGSAIVGLLVPSRFTEKIQDALVPVINLIVLPLYAFVSLSLHIETTVLAVLTSLVGIGVVLRVIGKSIGITLGAFIGSKFTNDSLPIGSYARLSVLGGIGFTVALFVNEIVFGDNEVFHTQAIVASLIAAVVSVLVAAITLRWKLK
ncbi:MAG: Na+/H+ antiporter NhaA [Acidobacteria bacterium]|nr:Na+/H+ antiporter NhaA [Acidobacteriota bacterium]